MSYGYLKKPGGNSVRLEAKQLVAEMYDDQQPEAEDLFAEFFKGLKANKRANINLARSIIRDPQHQNSFFAQFVNALLEVVDLGSSKSYDEFAKRAARAHDIIHKIMLMLPRATDAEKDYFPEVEKWIDEKIANTPVPGDY